jgi:sulfate adenylyltransferase
MEVQDRSVAMLDGDHVRQLLSSGLGFSREDRVLNIKRIGFVASEIVKAGGIVLACPIAPHEEARVWARNAVQATGGGFCLVHISTSFDDCEVRDRKGLYKKAREGKLKGLTGLDDPYETPEQVELTIDTGIQKTSVADAVNKVVEYLTGEFYLAGQADLAN